MYTIIKRVVPVMCYIVFAEGMYGLFKVKMYQDPTAHVVSYLPVSADETEVIMSVHQ